MHQPVRLCALPALLLIWLCAVQVSYAAANATAAPHTTVHNASATVHTGTPWTRHHEMRHLHTFFCLFVGIVCRIFERHIPLRLSCCCSASAAGSATLNTHTLRVDERPRRNLPHEAGGVLLPVVGLEQVEEGLKLTT
jgi:hypothetical protein